MLKQNLAFGNFRSQNPARSWYKWAQEGSTPMLEIKGYLKTIMFVSLVIILAFGFLQNFYPQASTSIFSRLTNVLWAGRP